MKQELRIKSFLYRVANIFISDSLFTRLKFRKNLKRWPNLSSPQSFNEKLNWIKLYCHNDIMTSMVDKMEAKKLVANLIGEHYIIPTIDEWDDVDKINFDLLPDKFVLKCTHDSGSVIVCDDKSKLDYDEVRRFLKNRMNRNFYAITREWPYKNVPHRIIAEEFIDSHRSVLEDYKFFCFNGTVDNVMVCLDRDKGNTKYYFFDTDWELLRLNKWSSEASINFSIPKPKNFEEMIRIASFLSKGFPFLRVDLYNLDGRIYFGELTFFSDGAVDTDILQSTDIEWGKKLSFESMKRFRKFGNKEIFRKCMKSVGGG